MPTDAEGKYYIECIVGNIIDKHYWGEQKEIRSGTKQKWVGFIYSRVSARDFHYTVAYKFNSRKLLPTPDHHT